MNPYLLLCVWRRRTWCKTARCAWARAILQLITAKPKIGGQSSFLKSDPLPLFVCAYRFEQQRQMLLTYGRELCRRAQPETALTCAEHGEVRCLMNMSSTVCMARNT
jgi:hypothetical protein